MNKIAKLISYLPVSLASCLPTSLLWGKDPKYEVMCGEVKSIIKAVMAEDVEYKQSFSNTLASLWEDFLKSYPDPIEFHLRPMSEKSARIEALSYIESGLVENNPRIAFAQAVKLHRRHVEAFAAPYPKLINKINVELERFIKHRDK